MLDRRSDAATPKTGADAHSNVRIRLDRAPRSRLARPSPHPEEPAESVPIARRLVIETAAPPPFGHEDAALTIGSAPRLFVSAEIGHRAATSRPPIARRFA